MTTDILKYHGLRKSWRAGNSNVIALPAPIEGRFHVYEDRDGNLILIPHRYNTEIIEVA